MKNKSRLMNLLLIVLFFLIILLVLMFIFLFKHLFYKEDLNNKEVNINKKRVITKKYDINNIEDIIFNFKNSNVLIYQTNDTFLKVKQTSTVDNYLFSENITDSSISLNENNRTMFIKASFKVYIPKIYNNIVDITNGFGNLTIKNIDYQTNISNNSGKLKINVVNKDINVENVSGIVKIKEAKSVLNVTSSTGDITINSLEGGINIETISGDLSINKFYIKNDSNIETITGKINIELHDKLNCELDVMNERGINNIKDDICTNKNIKLKIHNITGDVNIK